MTHRSRLSHVIALALLVLPGLGPRRAAAADLAALESLLKRPILDSNQPMTEVQAFCETRVPLMPAVKSASEWERHAARMRQDTLDRVVFRGEAARWRKLKTQAVWLDTLEGGPGYRIRKLRYEAAPGLWIPALLYEPDNLSGKAPVGLAVNGHEGIGKSVPYKQVRCINQAKRGMIVLNPEWPGMGQLGGTNYQHYRMNQLDLCGTSGLAPFYLAMARGLDILLAHPRADAARVAVSGLSGGGWQTIFISSLDTRVTLCNPVAGYSSFRTRARHLEDLGDSEQMPCDLATVTDYAHLTAMLAPRPALLTFNARDNCCFAAPHALPPLLEAAAPVYALHGRPDHLRSHVNFDPGDHNYGPDNRQAFYRMLGDHFFADDAAFDATEIPCETAVKAHTNLLVDLPPENATFNSLARALAKELPRQPKLPASRAAAARWQQANRARLREVLRARHSTANAERVRSTEHDGVQAVFWRARLDDEWTVPVVELSRGTAINGTVLVLADGGRAAAGAEVEKFLASGHRVLAPDPFYFGESRIRSHDFLFALLVSAVGERPLGVQAGQVAALARWVHTRHKEPVFISASGQRTSLIALAAAALEENAIAGVELRGSLGSLKEVIEQDWSVNQRPEFFCFGLLEAFDLKHLAALVAPRRLTAPDASGRVRSEWQELPRWYETLGAKPPELFPATAAAR